MSSIRPCFLLVDDHALFRTGLGMLLSQNWPQGQVLQAASWAEGLRMLAACKPDLILLDVHLPDGHGLQDLPALRKVAADCPVLLMSAQTDAGLVQGARDARVKGFLPKSATAGEVISTVRSALLGQAAFSAVPYELLAPTPVAVSAGGLVRAEAGAAWAVSEGEPALTPRQREILRYLGRHTPNKSIARQLGLSEADVRAEVSWLTEWLGARSREEAHAQALARGLLQP